MVFEKGALFRPARRMQSLQLGLVDDVYHPIFAVETPGMAGVLAQAKGKASIAAAAQQLEQQPVGAGF